jgi:choline dehydrogenase-like flavoprotein
MRQQDYPTNGLDWEARGMSEYSTSPNVRRPSADYPVNEQDSEIAPLMFNAVGGSTILWAAHFPTHPGDFRTKTEDGVGEDWPIGYETLEPFFSINDRMMGVSGLATTPDTPTTNRRCRRYHSVRPATSWLPASKSLMALVALRQRHPVARV